MATIWFEGIEELNTVTAEIESASGTIGQRGAAVVKKCGFQVEALAKGFAPVDTGALKNSISTEFDGDGRFGAMTADIGSDLKYSGFVEYGTRRMAPQSYLGPALDRVEPDFVAAAEAISMIGLHGGGGRARP
ncbi:HK97-gp10 family putative phage morphogenesis protein [Actinoplanes sp. NBRC 101535]|uniref:HK97-gp10 family putative phage morphogenesis protein n=1 Tax=Actinoplanes sp. NBRC 101535 TaxID=3032196 RepID=UPI0024A1F39A|nr:HK97-gp10 family putative phage morphogenesis protein [Actinoplanes sp. NBRC 101535]GLY08268.1 hypothetical protein Acsp01_86470 [Actinoplanes sp. NBRC 101535]